MNAKDVDPNSLLSPDRQMQLVELARSGSPADAIETAIREAAAEAVRPKWRNSTELAALEARLEAKLRDDSDLTFLARELGFSDHTMIHEAVKGILAKKIAHILAVRLPAGVAIG